MEDGAREAILLVVEDGARLVIHGLAPAALRGRVGPLHRAPGRWAARAGARGTRHGAPWKACSVSL